MFVVCVCMCVYVFVTHTHTHTHIHVALLILTDLYEQKLFYHLLNPVFSSAYHFYFYSKSV